MEKNRLFRVPDSIDFGQMRNEPFKWIYLLTLPYLKWVIIETNVCFPDLSQFYQFGKPWRLKRNSLTHKQERKIFEVCRDIGVNSYSAPGQAYLVTIKIYTHLIEEKIININQFEKFDFVFSDDLIFKNQSKINLSKCVFNRDNLERDKYLSELFSPLSIRDYE